MAAGDARGRKAQNYRDGESGVKEGGRAGSVMSGSKDLLSR